MHKALSECRRNFYLVYYSNLREYKLQTDKCHLIFVKTASAIFEGRSGALDWTHARALSEGAEAFEELQNGLVTHQKILLKP